MDVSKHPLVMIEWEDSAQPRSAWQFLDEIEDKSAIQCISVGWLVSDGEQSKLIAPNCGDIDSDSTQVSGVMVIPTRCIVKVTPLAPTPAP